MFGSTILEVAIGLVFAYCLYSLLATTISEIIASLLGLRARKLELAIERMLTDPHLSDKLFNRFYDHPMIKYMNDGSRFDKRPSYISAKNFSKAVVDIVINSGVSSGRQVTPRTITAGLKSLNPKSGSDTISLLESFLADSHNDPVKFREMIEQWFDDMMELTTGWYKRQSQWIVFVIGLIIAIIFNASTFDIVNHLSKDNSARVQLVQLATSYVKNHPAEMADTSVKHQTDTPAITQRLDSLVLYADSLYKADIAQSHQLLGIGWSNSAAANHMDSHNWPANVLGWIITALAISLGAPFWFDLLSKFVQLRGTRSESKDEKAQKKKPATP
jgi:hypothetical protein